MYVYMYEYLYKAWSSVVVIAHYNVIVLPQDYMTFRSCTITDGNSHNTHINPHRLRADTGPRMHHGAQILPYEQIVAAGSSCVETQANAKTSRPTPEDLSFIMYTSGTTGTPKGVILTQGGMVAAASALCTTVEVGEDDVHLSFLPMAHCFEICVQMAGVICGASGTFVWVRSELNRARSCNTCGI